MRILLLGTGRFGLPAFDAITDSADAEVVGVVTKPPAAGNRSPVDLWAQQRQLLTVYPTEFRSVDAIELLTSFQADLGFVCDYGHILPQPALDAFRLGPINLHGSLLPRHRGAAPVQWSILCGDGQVGVCTIRMTRGLDSGPIWHQQATEPRRDEDAAAMEQRLSELAVEPVLATLRTAAGCKDRSEFDAYGQAQDDPLATRAPSFTKDDGRFDGRWTADIAERVIRALQPWPTVFTELRLRDGKSVRLQIHKAFAVASPTGDLPAGETGVILPPQHIPHQVRQTIADEHSRLVGRELPAKSVTLLRCVGGWLHLIEVQVAGKRRMEVSDFAGGYCRGEPLSIDCQTPSRLVI